MFLYNGDYHKYFHMDLQFKWLLIDDSLGRFWLDVQTFHKISFIYSSIY